MKKIILIIVAILICLFLLTIFIFRRTESVCKLLRGEYTTYTWGFGQTMACGFLKLPNAENICFYSTECSGDCVVTGDVVQGNVGSCQRYKLWLFGPNEGTKIEKVREKWTKEQIDEAYKIFLDYKNSATLQYNK